MAGHLQKKYSLLCSSFNFWPNKSISKIIVILVLPIYSISLLELRLVCFFLFIRLSGSVVCCIDTGGMPKSLSMKGKNLDAGSGLVRMSARRVGAFPGNANFAALNKV